MFSQPSGDLVSWLVAGAWGALELGSWEESSPAEEQWCWVWVLVFWRTLERNAAVSDRVCF